MICVAGSGKYIIYEAGQAFEWVVGNPFEWVVRNPFEWVVGNPFEWMGGEQSIPVWLPLLALLLDKDENKS